MDAKEQIEINSLLDKLRAYIHLEYWDDARKTLSSLDDLLYKQIYGDY